MNLLKTSAAVALAALLGLVSTQGFAQNKPISNNFRIVIGSTSTGADTYQAAAIVAQALSDQLGINAKVDAVGATAAFDAISRISNGSTVMIFHDQAYLGYLYGVKGYFDIFADFNVGPTITINPGNAYLVPKDSPYQTIEDVIQACANGTQVRVAIQPGGVSEIGFSALKNAIKIRYPGTEENLVAVNTGSQSDKDQLLFDRQVDVIHGSVQGNEQYTRLPEDDQKAMRFIWLTAREATIAQANAEGMGETTRNMLLEFVDPKVSVTQDGTKNFTFDKEFFFLYNKDMDQAAVDYIDAALAEIFANDQVLEIQKTAFFIPDFRPSAEASAYLKDKMEQYKIIIEALQ